MKMHKSITEEKVVAAVERYRLTLDDPGFCIVCGAEMVEGIDPDARGYWCEVCGENGVYGAEELLLEF